MTEDFVVESVELSEGGATLRLAVPPDLRFFEGHFEGRPMLPGVAQLVALAHRRSREVFGDLGPEKKLARVKFEAVIVPGDALALRLEKSPGLAAGETQVRFEIVRDATRCASGVIVYGEGARIERIEHASEATAELPPLTAFMPHRPPMLLLDRLVTHSAGGCVCEKTIRAEDVFVDGGRISGLVTLELFAQAAAAHFGYLGYTTGAGFASGALLGTRKLELFAPHFAVGDRLTVQVTQVLSMPPAAQYECTLVRGSERLATGTINVAMGGDTGARG